MALGIFLGLALYGALDMARGGRTLFETPAPARKSPTWDQHYNIRCGQMHFQWYVYERPHGTVIINPN